MSNYRDDETTTAVATDSSWVQWGALIGDVSRVTASAVAIGLGVLVTSTATASDEASSRSLFMPVEQAQAGDDASTYLHAVTLARDSARGADSPLSVRVGLLATETATASDEAATTVLHVLTDQAGASDAPFVRIAGPVTVDTARGFDAPVYRAAETAIDTATGSDDAHARTRARQTDRATATASDEAFIGQVGAQIASASARAGDEAVALVHAWNVAQDAAIASDWPLFDDERTVGQAWTANTQTWAMSRYDPYGFEHIAAINGVLYGCNADGVYLLRGDGESIEGRIETGRLDLGAGALVHPVSAYLEYRLTGALPAAQMDVTTSQTGVAQTYTYDLPDKPADELVGGRFTFGRGLRARHFAFTLRLTGQRGHVNDVSVMHVPTNRRV